MRVFLIVLIIGAASLILIAPHFTSANQDQVAIEGYKAKCKTEGNTRITYTYDEKKLISSSIETLPADCFGEHCIGSASNAVLALVFEHTPEPISLALKGTHNDLLQYQKALSDGDLYGICIKPYTYNNRTRWRLNQELKVIHLPR